MTTDMSERERMQRFIMFSEQRERAMINAFRSADIAKTWGSPTVLAIASEEVAKAREANRQAVRLWYGRTTRL